MEIPLAFSDAPTPADLEAMKTKLLETFTDALPEADNVVLELVETSTFKFAFDLSQMGDPCNPPDLEATIATSMDIAKEYVTVSDPPEGSVDLSGCSKGDGKDSGKDAGDDANPCESQCPNGSCVGVCESEADINKAECADYVACSQGGDRRLAERRLDGHAGAATEFDVTIAVPITAAGDGNVAAQLAVAEKVKTSLADTSTILAAVAADIPGVDLADLEVTAEPVTEFKAEVTVEVEAAATADSSATAELADVGSTVSNKLSTLLEDTATLTDVVADACTSCGTVAPIADIVLETTAPSPSPPPPAPPPPDPPSPPAAPPLGDVVAAAAAIGGTILIIIIAVPAGVCLCCLIFLVWCLVRRSQKMAAQSKAGGYGDQFGQNATQHV